MSAQQPHQNGASLEKDFSNDENHEHLHADLDSENALRKIRTAGSISISPELFEKLYLSPQNVVKGDLRKTFGNPTPLALIGFLLSLNPLACDLMGWRGANGGSASIGVYFFFGGLLMVLGGLGEWIMGNTFPFVVFASFGAFWLAFGATLQPFYSAYGNYATDPSNPATGLTSIPFNSGFGFVLLAMGLLCFLYMILALRTNIVFFGIFFTLVCAFGLLTGAYWQTSNGNAKMATDLFTAAGAFAFVTCALGWWIFFAIMLAAMDFPFQLPVGDLSTFIKPMSERRKVREEPEV
ncbi:GPR1/FUN34/YaaH-class plasma membrane protein [Rhizodiscina lignyota]|uniref:GPR1/FUN34/YaaH-class plasma membrane protein n=1 Tax=Rhizodiscina lignyota TaxID=1504668 RepID=A0A9P4IGG5_9PEZI|nr:GPR1/FUN34/YaaH-class plasma membrane protein [Rhizodiscina lignyota]